MQIYKNYRRKTTNPQYIADLILRLLFTVEKYKNPTKDFYFAGFFLQEWKFDSTVAIYVVCQSKRFDKQASLFEDKLLLPSSCICCNRRDVVRIVIHSDNLLWCPFL